MSSHDCNKDMACALCHGSVKVHAAVRVLVTRVEIVEVEAEVPLDDEGLCWEDDTHNAIEVAVKKELDALDYSESEDRCSWEFYSPSSSTADGKIHYEMDGFEVINKKEIGWT